MSDEKDPNLVELKKIVDALEKLGTMEKKLEGTLVPFNIIKKMIPFFNAFGRYIDSPSMQDTVKNLKDELEEMGY